jgi:hypothetical protein
MGEKRVSLHLADSGGYSYQIWRIRKKISGNAEK